MMMAHCKTSLKENNTFHLHSRHSKVQHTVNWLRLLSVIILAKLLFLDHLEIKYT